MTSVAGADEGAGAGLAVADDDCFLPPPSSGLAVESVRKIKDGNATNQKAENTKKNSADSKEQLAVV